MGGRYKMYAKWYEEDKFWLAFAAWHISEFEYNFKYVIIEFRITQCSSIAIE